MSTPAPQRIGPYEIESRLGAGGMAETYVAVRHGPGGFAQRVCLKRLRPELERDPEFVRQFMAEAAIAAGLRHTAIAQVLDFGCDAGDYYMALELIDGCDLHELLEASGGALPHGLVVYVAIELATALDFAHRAGRSAAAPLGAVVHRDVSPSNTLVSREGEVKLADFGIARSLGAAKHTRTGIVKGKVPYMAPEYARSGHLDPRSDLFSLGVLLYECLCGARPHDGATDLETLERASSSRRTPLAERAKDAPAALVDLIECLLEPDPELRQQSAADVLEALLSLPTPVRARQELGARVNALAVARAAQSAPGPEHAKTELMPVSDDAALAAGGTARKPDPASASASEVLSAGEPGLRLARNRPWIALSGALLFAAGVLAFALLRETRREPAQEGAAERAAVATPPSAHAAGAVRPAATEIVVRPMPAAPVTAPAAGAAASPAQAADAQHARLEVIVMPWGQVTVDGKPAGKAPVVLALEPGAHTVEARNESGTLRRRVSLAANERKRVVLR